MNSKVVASAIEEDWRALAFYVICDLLILCLFLFVYNFVLVVNKIMKIRHVVFKERTADYTTCGCGWIP